MQAPALDGPSVAWLAMWSAMIALEHGRAVAATAAAGGGLRLLANTPARAAARQRRGSARELPAAASEGAAAGEQESAGGSLVATPPEPLAADLPKDAPPPAKPSSLAPAPSRQHPKPPQHSVPLAAGGALALLAFTALRRRRRAPSSDPDAVSRAMPPGLATASGSESGEAEISDAMRAPVLRGGPLALRRADGSWRDMLVLLRADCRLYVSDGRGSADVVSLQGALASPGTEPGYFTLHTAGEPCTVRCRSRDEAALWVAALNSAAASETAPLLRHMAPVGGRPSGSSSSEDDARPRQALFRTPQRRSHGPPAALRGALVATRALAEMAVTPIRVSAALLVLPFALALHGASRLGGAARSTLLGRKPARPLDPAAEAERRTGDASNPARGPLLDRFLGDCRIVSVNPPEVLSPPLSPPEALREVTPVGVHLAPQSAPHAEPEAKQGGGIAEESRPLRLLAAEIAERSVAMDRPRGAALVATAGGTA